MLFYSAVADDPLAQPVEHMTFNHGVRSSTLRWITKKENIRTLFGCFLFIQAAGLVWNQCACALYGIAKGVWHHAQACIRIPLRLDSMRDCVAIPYRNRLRIPYTASPWFLWRVALMPLISGAFRFLGAKNILPSPLHLFRTLWTWTCDF